MHVADYRLFPTRLVTLQFPDTAALDEELSSLMETQSGAGVDFNMHPDAMNLLNLAETNPAIARLRAMFAEGFRRWLALEKIDGVEEADFVLFSNYAAKGEQTLVHNHNADLVGIYYARTARHDRPPVHEPDHADDYFDPGDGLLVLHDPSFNANLCSIRRRDHVKIYPRPGLMLVFPAYVWHSVTPHQGEFPRLSFSMNCTLRWKGTARAQRHPFS